MQNRPWANRHSNTMQGSSLLELKSVSLELIPVIGRERGA
jgi:hypothetical protein